MLSAGFYPYDAYMISELRVSQEQRPLKPGLWSLRLIVEYEEDQPNKINSTKEDLFLVYKFLVQPSSQQKESSWSSSIFDTMLTNQFWSFNSMCSNEEENIRLDSIQSCTEEATWSSFYPDPKSDIRYGMKSENRLFD